MSWSWVGGLHLKWLDVPSFGYILDGAIAPRVGRSTVPLSLTIPLVLAAIVLLAFGFGSTANALRFLTGGASLLVARSIAYAMEVSDVHTEGQAPPPAR